MYKLVAVGGKLRGQEWVLSEGENTVGRAPDCNHQVAIQGVSKKHMSITVTGSNAFIEDLGSANGTFVNGKLVKKKSLAPNDKIAIPNVIFQLVYVVEKKVVVKKLVQKGHDAVVEDEDFDRAPSMPDSPPQKVIHLFRYKFMPVLHGFNEQYEWRALLGILLFIFILAVVTATIFPVLQSSKRVLISEMQERGKYYARMIARLNAKALERRDLDRLDTSFLANEEGIRSYELFDMDGRIVSPVEKLNKYISDPFSNQMWEAIKKLDKDKKYSGQVFAVSLGDSEIGIAGGIMAYDVKLGFEVVVGVIAIRFSHRTLAMEEAESRNAYLESLVTAALVAVLFFGIVYFMTLRPIEEMRFQIEESLRGKRKELDSKLLMSELYPLRSSINSLLQRIRELTKSDGSVEQDIEEDSRYVRILEELLQGAQGPVLILNSEKQIKRLNTVGEDILGIRESAASGTSLLDSARDQGFAATVMDLCDQSASNEGRDQTANYELTGKDYAIHVTALIGKDNFAKAFYITFVVAD